MANILIVVDMQNDFVTGCLGTPEARAIVSAVAERVRRAKQANESVIFTLDTHGANYFETAEGRGLPVAHCVSGSDGHELAPELKALADGSRIVEKNTFGSLWLMGELAGLARAIGDPEGRGLCVELCGVCTDICVVTNALLIKTRLPEADVCVRPDLCAGVTPEKHAAAVEVMRSCQIRIIE